MPEIIKLYKEVGETPLECLLRYKEAHPAYKDVRMTYLGRLDPMAEGLLLVLAGDTKAKNEYLKLDKTYEFEVFWGFETDTYDVLGLVSSKNLKSPSSVSPRISSGNFKFLSQIQNMKTQKYPPFSSKSFRGDFMRARDQKIEEVDLEENRIKIFSIEHVHTRMLKGEDILKEVTERINKVKGDFRQKQIIKAWEKILIPLSDEQFLISKFTADVSSGTYIRSIAHEMGKMLDTSALAYSIKRTRVGEFNI